MLLEQEFQCPGEVLISFSLWTAAGQALLLLKAVSVQEAVQFQGKAAVHLTGDYCRQVNAGLSVAGQDAGQGADEHFQLRPRSERIPMSLAGSGAQLQLGHS